MRSKVWRGNGNIPENRICPLEDNKSTNLFGAFRRSASPYHILQRNYFVLNILYIHLRLIIIYRFASTLYTLYILYFICRLAFRIFIRSKRWKESPLSVCRYTQGATKEINLPKSDSAIHSKCQFEAIFLYLFTLQYI